MHLNLFIVFSAVLEISFICDVTKHDTSCKFVELSKPGVHSTLWLHLVAALVRLDVAFAKHFSIPNFHNELLLGS